MVTQALQAVIFDMDGVIIDSEPLHERAQRIVFEENGLDVPLSIHGDFKGKTEEDVFEFVVREFGPGRDRRELVQQKHRIYRVLMEDLRPIDGALDFIAGLHADGTRMALTTSAIRANQQKAFRLFDLDRYFEAVITAEDVERPKPSPDPYLITVKRLSLPAALCLVIEDSLHGVRSAKDAGCRVAALTTSFQADDLRRSGADLVAEGFDELRALMMDGRSPL